MTKRVAVSELCTSVVSGGTPSRKDAKNFQGGTIPWVKTMDLSDGPIFRTDECITAEGLASSSAKMIPCGSTLIAMYGATVGRLGRLEIEAASNQAACALIVDNQVTDERWIYYAMLATRGELIGLASGAAQQNLNVGMVRAHQLPRVSLGVQQAVGEVLGAFDDKIAANRIIASASRKLASALMETASGSTKLSEITQVVRNSINPSALTVDRVRHFSLPAFDAGAAVVEAPAAIKSAKNRLGAPVVLVSKLNPRFPRIWAVDEVPEKEMALASTEFVALAPKNGNVGALWASLLDPKFTESLLARTGGTTGSHQRVKPDQMLEVEVSDVRTLSPVNSELARSLCRKVNDIAEENTLLAATRDELLPLLMNGKITVKDAEKTVEDVV